MSASEAQLYAAFLLEHPPEDVAYSAEDIEGMLACLPGDVQDAVRKVARRIGPRLVQIHRALQEREGR